MRFEFLFFVFLSFDLSTAEPGPDPGRAPAQPIGGGWWRMLKRNIGISAMHVQSFPNGNIVTYDRTTAGPSNISLPARMCLRPAKQLDCSAHSVMFNPTTLAVRPLTLQSDSWCSSGGLSPDGELVQTGGYNSGNRVVRYLNPCPDCDWIEDRTALVRPRWYSSNQILPNGQMIVVGGRREYNYEFVPRGPADKLNDLPFLRETFHKSIYENNLYPFLHLTPNGSIFVFANDRSILLDYVTNTVLRRYPVLPGGFARNYPSTGSSVLLPLKLDANGETDRAEVFICGGTSPDSASSAAEGEFLPATNTCGRMEITSENPTWEIEEMPLNRTMGDMILLPTGDVLIINGGAAGSAGWELGREPVLNPVLYRPNQTNGSRFLVLSPSTIPRMYHSTAHLLPDSRILVGGNNPHSIYNFTGIFPTDLSLEVFYPPYFESSVPRPEIVVVIQGTELRYKQRFTLIFRFPLRDILNPPEVGEIEVTMAAPAFTTHSFSMHQRVLVLATEGARSVGALYYVVHAYAPATANLAPPGNYQVFVVHGGFPSKAIWVRVK